MKKRTTAWAAPHGSRRRILSVLLSLTICLSLLPATALAAQTGSSDSSRTYARTSPASHCRQSARAELVMMEGNMPNSSERVFTQKSECLGVRE